MTYLKQKYKTYNKRYNLEATPKKGKNESYFIIVGGVPNDA
jgi:hypothetical protein